MQLSSESDPSEQTVALSVVIPAFNEHGRLGQCLSAWRDWLSQQQATSDADDTSEPSTGNESAQYLPAELLVVDDGSTDGTANLARDFDASPASVRVLVNEQNLGKGASVRRGMRASRGRIALLSDADLNVPAEELPSLVEALEAGYDMAIGSRLVTSANVKRPMIRRFTSWLFYVLRGILLLPDLRDTQCGFKAFRQAAAQTIFAEQTLDGYGFDLEILAIARRHGYTIKEVPVQWLVREGSKVRPVRDGLGLLRDVIRVRRKWGRGSLPASTNRLQT